MISELDNINKKIKPYTPIITQDFIDVKNKIVNLYTLNIPNSTLINACDIKYLQNTFDNLQTIIEPLLQSLKLSDRDKPQNWPMLFKDLHEQLQSFNIEIKGMDSSGIILKIEETKSSLEYN